VDAMPSRRCCSRRWRCSRVPTCRWRRPTRNRNGCSPVSLDTGGRVSGHRPGTVRSHLRAGRRTLQDEDGKLSLFAVGMTTRTSLRLRRRLGRVHPPLRGPTTPRDLRFSPRTTAPPPHHRCSNLIITARRRAKVERPITIDRAVPRRPPAAAGRPSTGRSGAVQCRCCRRATGPIAQAVAVITELQRLSALARLELGQGSRHRSAVELSRAGTQFCESRHSGADGRRGGAISGACVRPRPWSIGCGHGRAGS
jgi:hypothetical protein